MSDKSLPILKPREAVAECGVCGRSLYAGDRSCRSRSSDNIDVGSCPLLGDEWRMMETARAMSNAYAGQYMGSLKPADPT